MNRKFTWLEIGIDFSILYMLVFTNFTCAVDKDSIPYWISCIALGGFWGWTTYDYYRRRDELKELINRDKSLRG